MESRLLGALCAYLISMFTAPANAALVLAIDTYTNDELSFSISGTFDSDTIGESEGYLAIKNDWSNNNGIHTELFSSTPTITLNTITIGGLTPTTTLQNSGSTWMDNVFFSNPLGTENPFAAGTSVSGSMTLSGVGALDPADAATLELVSGFVRPSGADDWARLEASAQIGAVPVPAAVWLFGSGLFGMIGIARRKKA